MKPMQKKYFIALAIIVVGFVAAMLIAWFPFSRPVNRPAAMQPSGATAQAAARKQDTANLPHDAQTFQVAQASGTLPGIVQATIDPLGAHVGDTQKMTLVLSDPNKIVSVVAEIGTDHGTTTVPLSLAGATPVADLLPQRYAVGADGVLAMVTAGHQQPSEQDVAYAATPNDFTYTGSWLVHDTHDTNYETVFTVKDSAGNVNSVTMDWSDACGIPISGLTRLLGNCSETSLDGVENGNLTINANATLTLNSSTIFSINPGYSITLSPSGSIVIGSGSQIKFGYLWVMDADGDGYYTNKSIAFSTSAGSAPSGTIERRYLATGSGDCDDNDSRAFPGQTAYQTTPEVLPSGQTTSSMQSADSAFPWDFNCSGTVTPEQSIVSSHCATRAPDGCGHPTLCAAATGTLTTFGSSSCGMAVIPNLDCQFDEYLGGGGDCPVYGGACADNGDLLPSILPCL